MQVKVRGDEDREGADHAGRGGHFKNFYFSTEIIGKH